MTIRLRVTLPAASAFSFEHEGPTICIGRDKRCELSVGGEMNDVVSWRHARIELTARGTYLSDAGSSNGTFLNEQRVDGRSRLQVGDQLRLGQTGPQIEVVALDQPLSAPAPSADPAKADSDRRPPDGERDARAKDKPVRTENTPASPKAPVAAAPLRRSRGLVIGAAVAVCAVLAVLGWAVSQSKLVGNRISSGRSLADGAGETAQQPMTTKDLATEAVDVWVARTELKVWTLLDDPEQQFQRIAFPRDQEPAGAIRDVKQLRGQVLNRTLAPAQPVTAADLGVREQCQWKTDGRIASLAFTRNRNVLASTQVAPTRTTLVHILLVMDTEARNIGETVMVDERNLKRFLELGLPKDRYRLTILNSKEANRDAILGYYRNLKTGPNEALLCYYSGHGATDPAKGHFLALTHGGWLLRSDLRSGMLAKGARLTCILTDCCADIHKLKEPPTKRDAVPQNPILDALLFRHHGVVDINACSKGETAGCDDAVGGFFSHAFMTECNQDAPPNRIMIWDEFFTRLVKRTTNLRSVQHPEALTPLSLVRSFQLGRDSDAIASSIQRWALPSAGDGAGPKPLGPSTQSPLLRGFAVSPEGTAAVSGSDDGMLRVWTLTSAGERDMVRVGNDGIGVERLAWPHPGELRCAAVAGGGRQVLTGSRAGQVILWDADTGKSLRTLDQGKPVSSVAFASGDPAPIAWGLADGTVAWLAGKESQPVKLQKHTSAVTSIACAADGKFLFSASQDGQIIKWDLGRGTDVFCHRHGKPCTSVACSPDSRVVLFGSADGSLRVLNAQTGELLLTATGHTAELTCVALSADGAEALTGGADRTIRLWKLPR